MTRPGAPPGTGRTPVPGSRQVVGVIGGMGPLATAETMRRIVLATPAQHDQDHLHVIVDSDPSVPDRSAALLTGGADPLPHLVRAGRRLEAAGAELLIMPCNTAHAFHERLQRALSVPVLDMVSLTAAAARARGSVHGLLATSGTVAADVYVLPFSRAGTRLLVPRPVEQSGVAEAIMLVKAGGSLQEAARLCNPAVEDLAARGAEQLVLGCTELSLLAGLLPLQGLDALDVLVDEVVRQACGLGTALPVQARH